MGILFLMFLGFAFGFWTGYTICEEKWKVLINGLLEDQRKRSSRHSPNDSDIFP